MEITLKTLKNKNLNNTGEVGFNKTRYQRRDTRKPNVLEQNGQFEY